MADRINLFQAVNSENSDPLHRIKREMDQLFADLNISEMGRQVEEFGRQNPLGLAVAALTVGVAAGILMRKTVASF